MVGVTGSIPVAPTSLRLLRKLRLGKPASVYRSEASEGCRAEAVGRRRAPPDQPLVRRPEINSKKFLGFSAARLPRQGAWNEQFQAISLK